MSSGSLADSFSVSFFLSFFLSFLLFLFSFFLSYFFIVILALYKFGVMRGFQKRITLGVWSSRSFYFVGLQNWVAKKFAKFLHLAWDLSRG